MPAYMDANKKLLQYIEENKLIQGDRLPAESELSELLNISRLTLREAMNVLKQEGVIYSIQGKGTFVLCNYDYIADSLNMNDGITEMIETSGYKCGTSLFEKKIVKANENVARNLAIQNQTDVLMCERIRLADGIPVVFSIDYLAPKLVSEFLGVTDENISLYHFVENSCKIEIGQCTTEILPVVADEELAKKLSISYNTPLLKFFVSVKDIYGLPIIYAEEYLRADKFKFIVNRRR